MGFEVGASKAAESAFAKGAGEAVAAETIVGSSLVEVGATSVAEFAAMDAAGAAGLGELGVGLGELSASDLALSAGIDGAGALGFSEVGASAADLAALNGVEYSGAAGAGLGVGSGGDLGGGAGGLETGALNGYDAPWASTPQETMAGSDIGVSQGATETGIGTASEDSTLAETFNAGKDSQMANAAGVGMSEPLPIWAQQIKNGFTGVQDALKPYKPYYHGYQAASGLYDMYAANQKAGALRQQTSTLANLYQPGTPEYDLQMKQLAARDAAAGRRSQYGPRANELSGIMAKNRSNVMTSPGYTAMLNGQLNNQYAGAGKAAAGLSGLFL